MFTFASLFAGCGGFDLGATSVGGQCVLAVDNNQICLETYRANFPGVPAVGWDLTKGLSAEFQQHRPDVVLAGPPCQGFSVMRGRQEQDARNALLPLASRLAVQFQPKAIVIENVLGVLGPLFSRTLAAAERTLKRGGYEMHRIKVAASDAGLPQRRTRLFLIATRGRGVRSISDHTRSGVTLNTALSIPLGVPNHEAIWPKRGTRAQLIAARLAQGEMLSNTRNGHGCRHTWEFPDVYGATTVSERQILDAMILLRRQERLRESGDADPVSVSRISAYLGRSTRSEIARLIGKGYVRRIGSAVDLRHTFNGKYRRAHMDRLVPAVDTRFGDPSYSLHPVEDRGFTVREAARVQGFPDTFEFHGTAREQFTMVGNAVAPPVAAMVLRSVAVALGLHSGET